MSSGRHGATAGGGCGLARLPRCYYLFVSQTRTVEINGPLLDSVQRVADELETSPVEFIETAVEAAVKAAESDRQTERWERELIESYTREPQTEDELGQWDDVQAWPEP